MAQKREKEETELKITEPLIRTSPIPTTTTPNDSDGSDTNRSAQRSDPPLHNTNPARSRQFHQAASESDRLFSSAAAAMAEMKRREVNRCAGCRRKVGLTGFRCRCGEMFCPEHRYSDRHDCSFDYKAAGREMIARENPVVRAAKILKV